jgi:excinuclease ABC subunit C
MKGSKEEVLYIGKAKNLKKRVQSYFREGGDGRAMIPLLVSQVVDIETFIVGSEKEALLLENTLIKKHRPKYNALLKDDKSMIAITLKSHAWPKLEVMRYREKLQGKELIFGPYSHVMAARSTLNVVERLFPLRECSDQEFARRKRPCILYDMKRCLAPCVGLCTKKEYEEVVDQAVSFLKGQNSKVLSNLKKQMQQKAQNLEFEEAGRLLKTIESIETTLEKQVVDQPKDVDADFFGMYREGANVTVAMHFVRQGRLTGQRYFHFPLVLEENDELLSSLILQVYESALFYPQEICVNQELMDKKNIEEWFISFGKDVLLTFPKKGFKKKILALAEENAKATFKRQKESSLQNEKILMELKNKLHLNAFPDTIECFDQSNLSGTNPVSVVVCFKEGIAFKSAYRTYKVSKEAAQDDYLALSQVMERRYSTLAAEDMPDLIVIDGGKGHLNIALKVLEKLNIVTIDILGIAKEEARHDKGMTQEKIFIPYSNLPLFLEKSSEELFFLQRVRDEAHRFALSFQKKRRSKEVQKSILDEIQGIGPLKKRALLKHFGSLKQILAANGSDFENIPGISKKNIEEILRFKTNLR